MAENFLTDSATRAAKIALNGLSLRQQAISRNLANIDTPGYRAQTLEFSETIRRLSEPQTDLALRRTHTSHQTSATVPDSLYTLANRPGGTLRADQNNVDLDVELTDLSATGIQYQAVSQAISQKLLLLKTLAK
jgi:flagellar basal-body rod protein FlgB